MNEQGPSFLLTCSTPGLPAPVLTGVQAHARLDGVLFEMTLRQTYRNTGPRVLEVVYTFPLAHGAVLLGFGSELNGQRMDGVVVARREAERRYEESLSEGDAPVMLEAGRDGLHTANIGNLKPGDEIVLEVRYAQLLSFEQGRLRIAVPTTIAPRYGAPRAAGLQPQQVPVHSMLDEHRLELTLDAMAPHDAGTLECPTHAVAREGIPGGVRVRLQGAAWLDRDWVLLVTPREDRPSLMVRSQDPRSEAAPQLVMAALQPRPRPQRERIALKLLLDCSGSMGGDSIASARIAIQGLLERLGPGDSLSISRFGSQVEHLFPLTPCTETVRSAAARAVASTEANLGGTNMETALSSTLALKVGPGHEAADVLLVTDGLIWESKALAASARASGQRVFAIGVGSAPAEGVLRTLAEATGGACEFVTPGEALQAAAQRMLARMRDQPCARLRVDWGAVPAWQLPLPASAFGGDTVFAFAGFSRLAMPSMTRLTTRLLARDAHGVEAEIARGEASLPAPGDTLARMAAFRRLGVVAKADALRLAVDHQLMSSQTNCILVHVRSADEKAIGQAELRRVASMVAAGWGATGSVMFDGLFGSMPGSGRDFDAPFGRSSGFGAMVSCIRSTDPFGGAAADTAASGSATLEQLCMAVIGHLRAGGALSELPAMCGSLPIHPQVRKAIDELVALGLEDGQAWLLLAHWVNGRLGSQAQDASVLLSDFNAIEERKRSSGGQILQAALGGFAPETWRPSRHERLQRALRDSPR